MTMELQAAAAYAFSQLDDEAKKALLEGLEDDVKELFPAILEAVMDQTTLRQPPPADRLKAYRDRQMNNPEAWEILRLRFPRSIGKLWGYAEQMEDWRQLEEKERARR